MMMRSHITRRQACTTKCWSGNTLLLFPKNLLWRRRSPAQGSYGPGNVSATKWNENAPAWTIRCQPDLQRILAHDECVDADSSRLRTVCGQLRRVPLRVHERLRPLPVCGLGLFAETESA